MWYKCETGDGGNGMGIFGGKWEQWVICYKKNMEEIFIFLIFILK